MPFRSGAQNRYFRWAKEHPAEAEKRGLKPSVVNEFISASHGEKISRLPEHVEHKAEGGPARPVPFKW
jgi:hypothetical protein